MSLNGGKELIIETKESNHEFMISKIKFVHKVCHSVGISTTYLQEQLRFLRNDKKLRNKVIINKKITEMLQ
jgi:hypothetical protein